MTPTRALGWLENAPDERDFKCEELFSSPARPPSVFDTPDLALFRGPRYFQGPVSSCVPHAIKRAIRRCNAIAFMLSGRNVEDAHLPEASARFMYWNARQQVHAGKPPPFASPSDTGCYPRLALEAIRKVGYCREEVCPYDLSDANAQGVPWWVNSMPPPIAFHHAFDQANFVYQSIMSVGDERIAMVEDCLRAGWPVIFGMSIDQPFMEHVGEDVISGVDITQYVGGHMLELEAVEQDGMGGKVIRFDNWWQGFGDTLGKGRMTAQLFGSSIVRNVTALKSVPTYSEAVAA